MAANIMNVGEGIAVLGIVLTVAITENYWLLLLLTLPFLSWTKLDTKQKDIFNDIIYRKSTLELDKLREEIRLLKLKKK